MDLFDEQPGPEGHAEPAAEHAAEENAAEHGESPEVEAQGGAGTAPAPAYDDSSAKKWYIIHTYSGFENKVQESLRTRA